MPRERTPQIKLSPEERAQYDQAVRAYLQETVAECARFDPHNVDPAEWEFVRRREGMCVYSSVWGVADPCTLVMAGSGLLDGSLYDVMDGSYCDTTEAKRTMEAMVDISASGTAVMNVSEQRSQKDPFRFAGIKWISCKAVWGLLKEHDTLVYERSGLTVDAQGNEVGYKVLQSIRRPEWPMYSISGMQRQHISTCYLFRPSHASNKTEVFMLGSLALVGRYPRKVMYYGVSWAWMGVVAAPGVGLAKKYSALIDAAGNYQGTVCGDCSRRRAIFALDAKKKRPQKRVFCVFCIKSVVGNTCPDTEAREVDSDDELFSPPPESKCATDVSDSYMSSTQTTELSVDSLESGLSSSPMENAPTSQTIGPLMLGAELVLDW